MLPADKLDQITRRCSGRREDAQGEGAGGATALG